MSSHGDGNPTHVSCAVSHDLVTCGAEYTKSTVALSEVVDKYFSLDPFDPERANVVKVSAKMLVPFCMPCHGSLL